MTSRPSDHAVLLDHIAALVQAAQAGRRRILGVAGPPGAGKTTLVHAVLAAAADDPRLAGRVAHVPMDGFHRSNAELERLGRRDHKGAPDTFDSDAYAALLATAREVPRPTLQAPAFDHAVGDPHAGAITVTPEADVLVTEGNYLLLDDPAWTPVRRLLDEVWFCALDDTVRRERLVARHVVSGREADDAQEWVERSDEANARLVAEHAAGADLVIIDGQVVAG